MVKQSELIRCIYCGREGPPSDEHVLQRALGGNLTTKLVCRACNTGFSPIDQSLAEFSILTLPRVGNAALDSFPAYFGGNQLRVAPDGSWEEVRITNGLRPEILPQIHLVESADEAKKQVAFKGGNAEEMKKLITLISRKISEGTLGQIHVKEGCDPDCRNPRIVLHRHTSLYVRALNMAEAQNFLTILERNWSSICEKVLASPLIPEKSPSGVVKLTMKLCLNDNFRAVAKIAYNLLAVCKGPEFVSRPEFGPLREYILGHEIINDEPRAPDEIAVDRRFVNWNHNSEGGVLKTSGHSVLLGYVHPNLVAFITLYENFTFLVKMAEIEIHDFVFEGFEFNIDRSGFRRLDLQEIYERMHR